MSTVFVDTAAWAALFDERDRDHRRAASAWKRLKRDRARIVSSDYVFDETVTLMRRRAGFDAARRTGEALLTSTTLALLEIDRSLFVRAWDLHRRYADHDLSFTDCTTLAVIETHRAEAVFTYDRDFRDVGCSVVS